MSFEIAEEFVICQVESAVLLGTDLEEFDCLGLTPMRQGAEKSDEMMLAEALRSIQEVTEGFDYEKKRSLKCKKVSLG